MISDQERREVAAKLREKKSEFFGVRSFFPQDIILYQGQYLKAVEERLPDGDCFFDMLAELIDRSTCQNLAMKSAGEHVDISYIENCDDYHAKFCPKCGAEVVG